MLSLTLRELRAHARRLLGTVARRPPRRRLPLRHAGARRHAARATSTRCSPTSTPAPTSSSAAPTDLGRDAGPSGRIPTPSLVDDGRRRRRRGGGRARSSPGYGQLLGADGEAVGGNGPPPLGRQLDHRPRPQPLPPGRGPGPRGRRRGRRQPGGGRRRRPGGRRHDHRADARAGRGHDRRHRHLRRRRTAWAASRSPPSPRRRPGPRRQGARPGRRRSRCAADGRRGAGRAGRPGRRGAARRRRGDHRRRGQPASRPTTSTSEFLDMLHHVPHRVRRHRPAGGHLQHLQHVLDHRRPAQPGGRAAAGARRPAGAGAAGACVVEAVLVGRGRLGGRPGRRRRHRRAAQGPVRRRRLRAARRRPRGHRPARSSPGWPSASLVTLVAGVVPAVRASRVAPLAALREVAVERTSAVAGPGRRRRRADRRRRRPWSLAGGAGGGDGACSPWPARGAGARRRRASSLGPVVARPAAGLLGAPLARLRGMTGALARENAMRNPRRTVGHRVGPDGRRRRRHPVHGVRRLAEGVDRRHGRPQLRRRPGRRRPARSAAAASARRWPASVADAARGRHRRRASARACAEVDGDDQAAVGRRPGRARRGRSTSTSTAGDLADVGDGRDRGVDRRPPTQRLGGRRRRCRSRSPTAPTEDLTVAAIYDGERRGRTIGGYLVPRDGVGAPRRAGRRHARAGRPRPTA